MTKIKALAIFSITALVFTSIACVSNSKIKEPFPSWQKSAADDHLKKLDFLEAGLLKDVEGFLKE